MQKEDVLFQKGIDAFNGRKFYDAHEYWEELWLDYKLEDATFIQGLIQLSVSYFHYSNGNLKGARSMVLKCWKKFDKYEKTVRGIDVKLLKSQIQTVIKYYDKVDITLGNKDIYIITLKVLHD